MAVGRRARTATLPRFSTADPRAMRRSFPLLLALLAATAAAQPPTPLAMHQLTPDQIMAGPAWIGPPVEQAWWSWDGQRAYYTLKREGASIRDTYVQPIAGGI